MANVLTGLGMIALVALIFWGGMMFQKWRAARKAPSAPPAKTTP
jgi:hypothetical protein